MVYRLAVQMPVALLLLCSALQPVAALRQRTTKSQKLERTRYPEPMEIGNTMQLRTTTPTTPATATRIPLILHYIYLSGFDEFLAVSNDRTGRMRKDYYDSCVKVLPHWEIKFWNHSMADTLIKDHFPDFLPVWQSYDMEVKKADALRPFILQHYGGLYLDLDNECYEPPEKLFKDYDAVLQGSGWEGLNNGMMASAPGHPFWTQLVEVLIARHKGDPEIPSRSLPLYMTGPAVLAEAARLFFGTPGPVSGFISQNYTIGGVVTRVYCLGEFFMPCWDTDKVCQRQLEHGMALGTWDMSDLAGRHWFAGSWNKLWKLYPDKYQAPPMPKSLQKGTA